MPAQEPRIIDFAQVEAVSCPCGTARRALTDLPGAPCTLHLTEVSREAQTHYHDDHTEVYYILEGEGAIELAGQPYPVRPGMAVYIPPGVRHRMIVGHGPHGARSVTILNFVVPPFDAADEHLD